MQEFVEHACCPHPKQSLSLDGVEGSIEISACKSSGHLILGASSDNIVRRVVPLRRSWIDTMMVNSTRENLDLDQEVQGMKGGIAANAFFVVLLSSWQRGRPADSSVTRLRQPTGEGHALATVLYAQVVSQAPDRLECWRQSDISHTGDQRWRGRLFRRRGSAALTVPAVG